MSGTPSAGVTGSGSLARYARLDALQRTGLDATADPALDRFAAMTATVLDVPVALVSLVGADRQIFPGARGLGDPWDQQRQTPLSHSFCQHVVTTEAPLIVVDARTDPRVTGNAAIEDLGVIGYAGMPLTDADGQVLGSLCAIDHQPRQWTESEIALLADLAAACSDILRLRAVSHQATRNYQTLLAHETRTERALDRSQLLLRASVALAVTSTLDEVIDAVRDLVTGVLDPAYVGVTFREGTSVALATGAALPAEVAELWAHYSADTRTPSALAIASGRLVVLPDLGAVAAVTPAALDTFTGMGWQSAASAPLPGPHGAVGALTFVWKQPNVLDDAEQTVLAALAGYVAGALSRADVLLDRRTAAATMQQALLTPLPHHDHIRLAARYVPAQSADYVGGDWYDAVSLGPDRLVLVIGDISGHTVAAAATMSEFRSTLRALLIDGPGSPSVVLQRLDQITRALGHTTLATAVLAFLDTTPDGSHTLTWSNAGHPPPMLLTPGEEPALLHGNDILLGAVPTLTRGTTPSTSPTSCSPTRPATRNTTTSPCSSPPSPSNRPASEPRRR